MAKKTYPCACGKTTTYTGKDATQVINSQKTVNNNKQSKAKRKK